MVINSCLIIFLKIMLSKYLYLFQIISLLFTNLKIYPTDLISGIKIKLV